MYRIPRDRADVEAALTEIGFRYHPDPLGRISQGYWRSEDGEAIHGADLDELIGVPIPVANKRRGMRNRKIRKAARDGRKIHKLIEKRAEEKGWEPNPPIHKKATSTNLRPDLLSPRERYFELKPDTDPGRKEGKRKAKVYEKALRDRGEKKKVKPFHHRRGIGGSFRIVPSFGRSKLFLRFLRRLK